MQSYSETAFICGDIGLSADNSWFGKTIRFFENMWTKDAEFNHSFIFATPLNIIEALVKITDSLKSKYNNRTIRIYRIPLSDVDREKLSRGLAEQVGKAYGWDKYPLFILDATASWLKRTFTGNQTPVFWFTKTFHITNIPVCSQLVVWAIHKYTDYRFKDAAGNEVNWTVVNPDYLDDLLKLPINGAEIICEQKQ